MNSDDFLIRALEPLREPLRREESLAPRIVRQLDQASRADRVSAGTAVRPRTGARKSLVGFGATAALILAISLFGLFQANAPLTLAEVQAAVERHQWVHLVYQDGSETWVCLQDGKFLMKRVHASRPTEYYLRDPATRTVQRYDGISEIRQSRPNAWLLGRQRNGKIIPLEVDELTFDDKDLSEPRRTSDDRRQQLRAVRDFEIVVENGRKLGHFSDFTRDALGEMQIVKELWVDVTTKLPVRIRTWSFAEGSTKRVPREGTYHFLRDGPADLYDLGVPRTVRIVPQIESVEDAKSLISAETWKAMEGAKAAVRRFPHRFRVLTVDGSGTATITYVDSGHAHPFDWAGDRAVEETVARQYFADCQNGHGLPPETAEQAVNSVYDLRTLVPADALARGFPFASSINTRLIDGKRWFVLTRSWSEPPTSRLQVLTASSSHSVHEIDDQWEYAHWNWTELATGQSEEIAPAGQILVHAERRELKKDWFVDPGRDYTVARHVQYRLIGDRWEKRETRAVHWERLPEGPWYVSVWETRSRVKATGNPADGNLPQPEEEQVDRKRIVITPLEPEDFPADLFDGDKFLEAARASGAQIRVD
jgi:hypothetical protein